ncbi:ribokinase [Deinococcus arcticus]|uniref:Ribokinase n=1 Tax=Deinococcus arcticus TaxID=2136176 RepID=A0A2T3W7S4_9DEIO|nr:ribokinase [Deinococcus arcticus]PTA67793.1 ribokinase [Deinococcus arcticus]
MGVLVVGSLNVDLTVAAPRIPAPGETVLGSELHVSPGGKGANQALAAARAGAAVALVGAVGQDTFAPQALQLLRAAGVKLDSVRAASGPTGVALITVAAGGENAITVAGGANAGVTPGDLPADLGPHTHLLLQQELPPAVTLAAAQRARAAGRQVLLNAAPSRDTAPELLACTHHLIVNEHELAALAGAGAGGGAEVAGQARALLARGPEAVTVTLGARGSVTVTARATHALPAHPVTVADTTGAGDTFCGVLAARLSRGDSLSQALHWAGVAAALTCTRRGAQAAMPLWAEVQAAGAATRPTP